MGEYTRVEIVANDGGTYVLNDRLRQLLADAGAQLGYSLLERIRQGSYHSGTTASGGTHDGGGAVDLSIKGLDEDQVDALLVALRGRGCAAWHRTPDQGDWGPHVHAIDSGDTDVSDEADWQVSEYAAGRNGLASRGTDDGPPIRPLQPYTYREDDMTPDDVWEEKLPATPFSAGVKEALGDTTPDDDVQAGAALVNLTARVQRLETTINRIAKALGVKPAGQ